MSSEDVAPAVRKLDMESLSALAHPLRVQIFDTLSTYGSFTASGLAERLGESSGATSYHLRQLAKHGFVREVEGKGSARERWWERTPGGIHIGHTNDAPSPAEKSATRIVSAEFERNRERQLRAFQELTTSEDIDPATETWHSSSTVSTINLRLTLEQLAEVSAIMDSTLDSLDRFRGQNLPGSRPVQVHVNVFPIVDGEITPGLLEPEGQPNEALFVPRFSGRNVGGPA